MAGYRLHKGKKDAFYPLILVVISLIPIFILANNYNLTIKNTELRDLPAIILAKYRAASSRTAKPRGHD